jgi:hypothetical protein
VGEQVSEGLYSSGAATRRGRKSVSKAVLC